MRKKQRALEMKWERKMALKETEEESFFLFHVLLMSFAHITCLITWSLFSSLSFHYLLRSKRLAPVLIKEITRRVNLSGRWQAVYTAGTYVRYIPSRSLSTVLTSMNKNLLMSYAVSLTYEELLFIDLM